MLHNGELGKISKEQRAGEFDVWKTSLSNPDFSAFATSCGALGIRVSDPTELDDAIGRQLAERGA